MRRLYSTVPILCLALCITLCPFGAPTAEAAANVTITVNDHLECSGSLYTGITNYINFHIENDEEITALSLGFLFSGYAGQLQWQPDGDLPNCAGTCYMESGCRAQSAFDLLFTETQNGFNGSLPDSILIGGAAISQNLAAGDASDIVFRLAVFIAEGEPAGSIEIDNILFPPGGNWEVAQPVAGSFPPDYFGCNNSAVTNPDCPAVSFPVVARECGDVNGSGGVGIDDLANFAVWISGGSDPCPLTTADVNGDCAIDSTDLQILTDHIFASATLDCSCDITVPICGDTCDTQLPGDINRNHIVELTDLIELDSVVSCQIPPPSPATNYDLNGDCIIDQSDADYLDDFLNNGGPPPVACSCVDPQLAGCSGTICTNSTADPVLLLCPGGDAAFHVYLKDGSDNPIAGDSTVWIEFMNCSDVDTCNGGTQITRLDPIAPSNAQGQLTFYAAGGGCTVGCQAVVMAPCGTIATVPVRSFDINGDMGVSLGFDFDFSECNNYNGVPGIQFADQNIFYDHVGHFCGLSPCDRFSASFSLDPGSSLAPGQHVDLTLTLENNNFESCFIGFIGFFSSGFGTGGSQSLIENYNYNKALLPGETDTVTVTYVVPGEGHGCLSVEFTNDCCSTSTVLEECAQSIWHCGADGGLCYDVFIRLDGDPVENIVVPTDYLADGWFINEIHVPTSFPITALDSVVYQICTPVDGNLGDDSRVPVEIWYDAAGTDVDIFESQVFITPRTGDADGSCGVSIGDAVYIINYIFGGGPAPMPCQAGDVDCSGAISISDAVYLINFIFGGGPAPCIPDDMTPEPTCN